MTLSNKDKNKIASYFADKKEVAAVYLYGSQARGDAKADSDIDLGILLAGKIEAPRAKSPRNLRPGSPRRAKIRRSEFSSLHPRVDNPRVSRRRTKQRGLDSPQFSAPFDLGKLLDKEVEVQDLEVCEVDFAHRVLTEGKLLVSNNERVRIAFEERVFQTYFDLKPAFDEYFKHLSEIARRGELGVRQI